MDTSPTPPSLLQQHALPTPVINVAPVPAAPAVVPKHFLAAFFLSFFLGVFGADRFYLGQYVSGTLKFLTFGWFGIGAVVDVMLIMNGAMKDSKGQPLAGYEEYKGLAKRVTAWIMGGSVLIAVVLIVAAAVILPTLLSEASSLGGIGGGASGPGTGSGGGTSLDSSDYMKILMSI